MSRLKVLAVLALAAAALGLTACQPKPHNVIIFVADGLRSQMVTPETAPALAAVRAEGVDFRNSHSVYPTLTTVNASSIATGHSPGDHGDFGNALYTGEDLLAFPVNGATPFLEDDETLGLMNARFGNNYLDEASLLSMARAKGLQTAAIGKVGPTAIQDVTARQGETLIIDDETGSKGPGQQGLPLPQDVVDAIKAANLPVRAPDRGLNGPSGAYNLPGVQVANVIQQAWFADVAAKVILPRFAKAKKPFVLVFWSRDPDGTQHNQGDSLNQLVPGINGPTSLAAIRNASNNLGQLRDALKALGLDKTTDVIVTADHGFSTISKQSQTSGSAALKFPDVVPGFLPPGFLAWDLAKALNLPLNDGSEIPIDPSLHLTIKGSGALLGRDPKKPDLAVAFNGGSDLIYVPSGDHALAEKVVQFLTSQDYTASIFTDDRLGPIAGALPLSAIGLKGAALTPTPAIVVGFRSWSTGCAQPETCAAEVADTTLQQGQGMHGSFSRADTHNFMAAVGPDFRKAYVDPTPVANTDLPQTLAKILGLSLPSKGTLSGRVLTEALAKGAEVASAKRTVRSTPAANGFVTVLNQQDAAGHSYYDAAGAPGRTLGLAP
jgi:arylsulfatase A-like enzyme